MPQLFHVQFGVVQRSAGGDARKVSAYQRCARVERRDGKAFDFRRKWSEHVGHEMLLPEGAPEWAADPAQLWQRAEDLERRGDAQVARLVEFAIPRDVPADARLDFVRAVAAPWIADGMAAQVDLHCLAAADGAEQPHAHVMLTLRRFDCGDFAAMKMRGWNADFTADRGRRKRGAVAERMNSWLAQNGIGARVDHRTHAEQGITGAVPERNASRRAWRAHAADATSGAAEPERQVLAERRQRQATRRDAEWEAARAAYAKAAAEYYEAEREHRAAARKAQRTQHQADRAALRAQQRSERDRTYRATRKGAARDISLMFQRGRHDRQRSALDVEHQADQMTGATATTFPVFDQWIEERAAGGDHVAQTALTQRQSRRKWLARKDPAAAARRAVDDVIRAADRVINNRPRASVDDQELFAAERDRITARRDQAAGAARAARRAAVWHWRSAGFWRRWTDPTWRAEHVRLTNAARAERRESDRLRSRYDADVRTARKAAQQAARVNRRTLMAWLDRPDVRAAQAALETARRVRTALDAGDQDTITAAARGDLPGAAGQPTWLRSGASASRLPPINRRRASRSQRVPRRRRGWQRRCCGGNRHWPVRRHRPRHQTPARRQRHIPTECDSTWHAVSHIACYHTSVKFGCESRWTSAHCRPG